MGHHPANQVQCLRNIGRVLIEGQSLVFDEVIILLALGEVSQAKFEQATSEVLTASQAI